MIAREPSTPGGSLVAASATMGLTAAEVTTIVAAFVGGGLGAVGAPALGWSIEKRRDRQGERRALIAQWRNGVRATFGGKDPRQRVVESEQQALMRAQWYQDFRIRAKGELVAKWEKVDPADPKDPLGITQRITVIANPTAVRHPLLDEIEKEINRIEGTWHLP